MKENMIGKKIRVIKDSTTARHPVGTILTMTSEISDNSCFCVKEHHYIIHVNEVEFLQDIILEIY